MSFPPWVHRNVSVLLSRRNNWQDVLLHVKRDEVLSLRTETSTCLPLGRNSYRRPGLRCQRSSTRLLRMADGFFGSSELDSMIWSNLDLRLLYPVRRVSRGQLSDGFSLQTSLAGTLNESSLGSLAEILRVFLAPCDGSDCPIGLAHCNPSSV